MPGGDPVPFHELAQAAYCPRKLYYARRHDDGPPDSVAAVRALAFEYPDLLDADDAALADRPVAVPPATLRRRLHRVRRRHREAWPDLAEPPEREVVVTGRDCRGRLDKVVDDGGDPVPSLVSPGRPPERGVWEPQGVRAVAAGKALAWREETPVERAFVEYPAHGTVRQVRLTTRRKAAYRRALRAVRSLDGPPPRLDDRAKCEPCEYRERCGVKTRSLRSLLGL